MRNGREGDIGSDANEATPIAMIARPGRFEHRTTHMHLLIGLSRYCVVPARRGATLCRAAAIQSRIDSGKRLMDFGFT